MSTQIQTASKPQVGYRGFKYNVNTFGGPVAPGPGEAAIIELCGEECYYYAFYINRYDANGTDIYLILSKLGAQPFTIDSSGYVTVSNTTGSELIGDYFSILGLGVSPVAYGVCYFDFGTSQNVPPYNGYTMAGNLNGTAIGVGTSYIGIGSSTSNTTETNRAVFVTVSQGQILNAYVRTAGVMTGSMQLAIMINGVQVGTPYTIPAGSAATTYYFLNSAAITNNSPVSIRVVQSTATSSGVLAFGWTIK